MSTPQEDRKQELNDELNAPLDAIADVGIDKPHEMLDEAVKAKVISEEVKDKIQTEMPGHTLLFQKNLAVERKSQIDKVAVRRAFVLTYGKFMLEADNELKKPDSVLMMALEKVVKFPVDRKLGLKGRTELEAAAAQLDKVRYSRKANEYANDQYMDRSIQIEEAKDRKTELEEGIVNLETAHESFGKLDISSELDKKMSHLEEAYNIQEEFEVGELEERRLELHDERRKTLEVVGKYIEIAFSLRWTLVDLRNSVKEHVDDDDELKQIDDLIKAFDELGDRSNFDSDGFQTFLQSNLKPVLDKLHPAYLKKLGGVISPTLHVGYANPEVNKDLKTLSRLTDQLRKDPYISVDLEAIGHIDSELERLGELGGRDIDKNLAEEIGDLHKDLDRFDGDIREFREAIVDYFGFDQNFSQAIQNKCDEYLTVYGDFQWDPVADLDYKHFRDFVENSYKSFIEDIVQILNSTLDRREDTLDSNKADLVALKAQSGIFQRYAESGLHAELRDSVDRDLLGANKKMVEVLEKHESKESDRRHIVALNQARVELEAHKDLLKEKSDELKLILEELDEVLTEKGKIDHKTDDIGMEMKALIEEKEEIARNIDRAEKLVAANTGSNEEKFAAASIKVNLEKLEAAKEQIRTLNQKMYFHIRDQKEKGSRLQKGKRALEEEITVLEESIEQAVSVVRSLGGDKDSKTTVGNLGKLEEEIEALNKQVVVAEAELKALDDLTPENRLIEDAFSGLRFEDGVIKVRGFETNFEHVAKQLDESRAHFASPTNIPEMRKAHLDLKNQLDQSGEGEDAVEKIMIRRGIDKNLGIQTQLTKIAQLIKSNDSAIRSNNDPPAAQIEKILGELKRKWDKDHGDGPEFEREDEEKKIRDPYQARRDEFTRQNAELDDLQKYLQGVNEQSKVLHENMRKTVDYLEIAHKAEIGVEYEEGKNLDIPLIVKGFNGIDLKSRQFKPEQLTALYSEFRGYFDRDSNVVTLVTQLREAQADVAASTNLTDAEAAKKLVHAIVAKQYPDLPIEEQQKVASAVLADDIQTIQTEQSYEELAEGHHAELADTVNMVGVQGRLVNFKYTEGDKDHQPFKGLTPKDFASWERMEKLFDIGKLNYQNGFFALAAFEIFSNEGDGKASKQSVELRKKLRLVLADELGVDERMDEAGVNRIIDDAFNEQMEKAIPLVQEYFKEYGENSTEWKQYKVNELQMRLQIYDEQLKLGKIDQTIYKLKCDQVYEEARAYDVADRFTQSSVVGGFWNSKHSQWMRDKGLEVGSYAARKAKAGIFEGGMLYLRGLVGGVKLAVTTTAQTILKAPVSILKNGGLLAISPLKWGVNLKRRTQNLINKGRNWFRKRKGKELKEKVEMWTPFSVGESVRKDLGRVGEYSKTKASKTWEGTKAAFGKVGGFWSKETWKSNAYKDRTDVDTASLEKQADELAKAGQGESIQVESSPYIDIDKYRVQLQELDKMTGVPDAQAA